MAAREGNTYAFDLFEGGSSGAARYAASSAARAAAAPQKREEKREPGIRVKRAAPAQLRQSSGKVFSRAAALLIFAVVVMGFLCLQLSAGARRYELKRDIANCEETLEVKQSENIRLNAELNGKVGIGAIEDYAVNILGMTKLESYQVECIDLSEGDTVIYANGSPAVLGIFSGD